MQTVKGLLDEKGYAVWSISSGETMYRALELMAEKDIGGLMVIDGETVGGIITERDYCRKVILRGKSSSSILVRDLMTRELISASPEDQLEKCLALMVSNSFRHLPVFDQDKLIGIVTLADVIKQLLSKQKKEIDNFENLIYGGYGVCKDPSTLPGL